MKKKITTIKILLFIINLIIVIRIYDIAIINHEKYLELSKIANDKIVESNSTLRGRILDKFGNVLVDNKGINVLIYTKIPNITSKDELEIASLIAKTINLDNYDITELSLKEYLYKKYKTNIDEKVSELKLKKYKNRKISENDFLNYKYSLIDENLMTDENKREAVIYNLMNKGYSYQDKVIKKNVTDEELTKINELNLKGIRIDIDYIRVYKYDTSLNQIFGSIGKIEKEKKEYYLSKGYKLDATVGVSFLESTYEEYLKGEARKYKINPDNTLTLIDKGKKGSDLILTIDIEKQVKIDNILKEEILKAKKFPSAKYYKGSNIVVSDPTNGHIEVMSSYEYLNDTFVPNTIGILKNSYTVGSVVKAASMSTLYKYGIIDNKKIKDSCVKLYSQKEKCSWKDLGYINDIDALAYSSNYYQFIGAIKMTGNTYNRNMKFNPTKEDFNKYRDYFKTLGLGDYTKIDIEGEELGITGSTISGDLLLNLSIGQYDTYTTLMLNNYIATIANGKNRYKLKIADSIVDENSKKTTINPDEILSKYEIDEDKYLRIKEGLRKVVTNGTATFYINKSLKGSGKTGTSETYYNGVSTYTKSFIAYVPSDNPKYAITIISPNISYKTETSTYKYPINSKLSRNITNILFENS